MEVAIAHTGPARTVMLTGCHSTSGTQNHSGRPTRPSLPRGGAVAAASVGTESAPIPTLSRSTGLIAGVPVLVLTCTSWPPSGPRFEPGQVMMSHW